MRLKRSQSDGRLLKQDWENLGSFLNRLQNDEKAYYIRIVKYIRLVLPFFDDFELYPEFGQFLLCWKERAILFPKDCCLFLQIENQFKLKASELLNGTPTLQKVIKSETRYRKVKYFCRSGMKQLR